LELVRMATKGILHLSYTPTEDILWILIVFRVTIDLPAGRPDLLDEPSQL
jgi:hypothetical protein